jgi:hypothetical protein
VHLREVDQRIFAGAIHESVRQTGFADFALELAPVNASEVLIDLSVLLSFEPRLQTEEVNVLNATSACADLQQGVVCIEFIVPAQTALRNVVTFRVLTRLLFDNRSFAWCFVLFLQDWIGNQ